MPPNRNALIRYKTIDKCLKNRLRKWTLESIMDSVSEALYEYEGTGKDISRRTIQADIQMMRSDMLGYNAPIIVVDRKYYTYEDPEYSITNIPISDHDLTQMNEAVDILKQFKGFSHFSSLNDVVQKLENHVYVAKNKTRSVIEFEKNDRLKGLEYLETIYTAIINSKAMSLTYQSFKAREASTFVFHAWWLKEFKNRWFAVGVKEKEGALLNLALDRILELKIVDKPYYIENDKVQHDEFYKNVIGVTVNGKHRPSNIKIFINAKTAPYVETKPFHHSQEVVDRRDDGIVINLKLIPNFELEKELLGHGEDIMVLSPPALCKRINGRLHAAVANYRKREGVSDQTDNNI
ncbi:WYL domain-containing protein [Flavipsychrobacter stenotrophus]|uniref:WYL domain-containing protein n=1 Tax=Flavipsychrobacter stenotrophus TaxID=2077091 RepID=A0A2S7SZQ3_9BACT|nr:WYL domain-containing protein [Flavipsychrobacter stenotrophus]PQJ11996.1 WYL domain-containing protein [Flavipsychrobacter stenotrophus]